MKLTKDEARMLSYALEEGKYTLVSENRDVGPELMNWLNDLQARLEKAGKDQRRTGRTSQDDYYDLKKRILNIE